MPAAGQAGLMPGIGCECVRRGVSNSCQHSYQADKRFLAYEVTTDHVLVSIVICILQFQPLLMPAQCSQNLGGSCTLLCATAKPLQRACSWKSAGVSVLWSVCGVHALDDSGGICSWPCCNRGSTVLCVCGDVSASYIFGCYLYCACTNDLMESVAA